MKQTITNAVQLAKMALDQNITLGVQTSSPLDLSIRAVTATRPIFTTIATSVVGEKEQLEAVESFITNPLVDDITDVQVGALVANISAQVSKQVDYMRNVIVPAINDYVQRVQVFFDKPDQFVNKFEILVSERPGILNELGFIDNLNNENGGILADPDVYVKIPTPSTDAMAQMCLIGESSYDQLIAQWFNRRDISFFVGAWESLFGQGAGKLTELFEHPADGGDYTLFTYLVTRRLIDNPPEGVEMTLKDFNRYLSQYKDAAAKRLTTYCKQYKTLDDAGLLILKVDRDGYCVEVNENVYRKFISEGGKNEVIFGCLLSGDAVKNIASIQEKATTYLETYERYEQVYAAKQRLNALNKLQTGLKIEFVNMLSNGDFSDREKDAHTTFGLNVETMAKKADEVINTITAADVGSIHNACLKVMARARFYYTDCERFLTGMNEVAATNPAVNSREAALPALIELVTDYVYAQFVKR